MSTTKIRLQPLDVQKAYYEEQIKNIDANIAKAKEQRSTIQKILKRLSKPEAQEKLRKKIIQHNNSIQEKERKEEAIRLQEENVARRRARIEREIEQCLRMNGKIV